MKGYRLLALYVFASNWRAQRLYKKYGFDQEGVKYAKMIREQNERGDQ